MTRWNPNLYLKEGQDKGFSADYLNMLTGAGSKLYSSNVPVVFTLAHLANVSNTLYADLQSIVSRQSSVQDYPYKNFSIKSEMLLQDIISFFARGARQASLEKFF